MASSLPIGKKISILLSLLVCFIPLGFAVIEYHNGPLLKGQINLSVIWYGKIPPQQKYLFLIFIKSLEDNPKTIISFEPQVSKWWKQVESYQTLAKKESNSKDTPGIEVTVVNEVDDQNCSQGENLSKDSIPLLINKAAPNTVAVIFIAKEVGLEGSCLASGKCSMHGSLGKQVYIVVKDQTKDCPEKCGWPFFSSELKKKAEFIINPPNQDKGIDLAIMHAASALASTVTNPYGNGFYVGNAKEPMEIGRICNSVFGTGAFPGFTGKIHIDPRTAGGFNAHGLNNTKLLLPGLWNPQGSSCWTIM
ncbi:protein EXORDIUM-like [Lycium ferocissimum]|uniref:protein EXORDIUM-like n=1 Tax=Lycium ferocissimum TaxID=112874 RepID=UPI00281500E7|nr:protein EXORDIUM-like [Lycium ferocissimum]